MKNFKLLRLTAVFVLALSASSLFGQGVYVSLNGGYSFAAAKQELPILSNYTFNNNSVTVKENPVSLGEGTNFGAAFGYMFNENLGIELGVSYLLGSELTAQDIYDEEVINYTLSSNMLSLRPALVLSVGTGSVKPYGKFGLVAGLGNVYYGEERINTGNITKEVVRINGGIALGVNAVLGANFSISEKVALFGEINAVSMSYTPTKGEVTEFSYNGADELSSLTTNEREIEYVDTYTFDFNNPPSDSQPDQGLKLKLPFSSVGINVGVRVGF